MPRKTAPAAIRLLKGRSPGRDSGGRVVPPPPPPVFTPPPIPRGLPAPVRRQFLRVVAELQSRELPMPSSDVLVGHARTLVRQQEVAAALDAEPAGTIAWRRLIITESGLSKRVGEFCREYFADAQTVAIATHNATATAPNPFDWANRPDWQKGS